jgi:hypothetical protein
MASSCGPSVEFAGGGWLWGFSERLIQGDFDNVEGSKAAGFSHGQFGHPATRLRLGDVYNARARTELADQPTSFFNVRHPRQGLNGALIDRISRARGA